MSARVRVECRVRCRGAVDCGGSLPMEVLVDLPWRAEA